MGKSNTKNLVIYNRIGKNNMKAIILNSGKGSRLGKYTENKTKCMVELYDGETIISYQLKHLMRKGIKEIIVTTGYLAELLESYISKLNLDLQLEYVYNPKYNSSNYILSMNYIEDYEEDILLLHGDLVFSDSVLEQVINSDSSCMVIDSTLELPEKDFKAQFQGKYIKGIGIDLFDESTYAAQPLYKLVKNDWLAWKNEIRQFCKAGNINVYAEDALNMILNRNLMIGIDISGNLCCEIDNEEDLIQVRKKL